MSEKHCPGEAELLRFVDEDLSPEQVARMTAHLAACTTCSEKVSGLRDLIDDVRAPISVEKFPLGGHVAEVMSRLDAPAPAHSAPRRWLSLGAGGLAVAATAVLVLTLNGSGDEAQGRFTARGTGTKPSLSRDVGVQLYQKDGELRPLQAGDRIRPNTALTAGLRNLGTAGVYLLLFAVDARNQVHWIAPEYTVAGQDPGAVNIAPARDERLLPSAVAFDDLSEGPLRVIALLGPKPLRVSDIEALPAAELDGAFLMRRFAGAEIRQFQLDVAP
jgi:hypothetical protein